MREQRAIPRAESRCVPSRRTPLSHHFLFAVLNLLSPGTAEARRRRRRSERHRRPKAPACPSTRHRKTTTRATPCRWPCSRCTPTFSASGPSVSSSARRSRRSSSEFSSVFVFSAFLSVSGREQVKRALTRQRRHKQHREAATACSGVRIVCDANGNQAGRQQVCLRISSLHHFTHAVGGTR